ncbi:MAG: hypothetical protein M3O22_01275 [Pseudomonadota bacterium]|nr:hypothetical protein [Pseudomonadota bacterium]
MQLKDLKDLVGKMAKVFALGGILATLAGPAAAEAGPRESSHGSGKPKITAVKQVRTRHKKSVKKPKGKAALCEDKRTKIVHDLKGALALVTCVNGAPQNCDLYMTKVRRYISALKNDKACPKNQTALRDAFFMTNSGKDYPFRNFGLKVPEA